LKQSLSEILNRSKRPIIIAVQIAASMGKNNAGEQYQLGKKLQTFPWQAL
jgi:hypothetical protein